MYVETFTHAKDPLRPDLNEDRLIVHADRTFAVADGVTDKSGASYDGATGGVLAGRAIDRALRTLTDEGSLASAAATDVVGSVTAAIAELYDRLGVHERALTDPTARFAAAMAVTHVSGDQLRVVTVGDCGVRVDGRVVAHAVNRLDTALSQLRRAAFECLTELEPTWTLERRLEVARWYTVEGLAADPTALDVTPALHSEIVARCRAAARANTGDWEPSLAEAVTAGGLKAVARARRSDESGTSALARAGIDFGVIDGFPVSPTHVTDLRLPFTPSTCIEVFSDGYFGWPERYGKVAYWEEHFRRVESEDPHRIAEFASTKGSSPGRYADDRSVLIVRKEPQKE